MSELGGPDPWGSHVQLLYPRERAKGGPGPGLRGNPQDVALQPRSEEDWAGAGRIKRSGQRVPGGAHSLTKVPREERSAWVKHRVQGG